jgi:dihydrofolate reductase
MHALGSKPLGAFSSERSSFRMRGPFRIEGYAIASADGMIADATGFMPDSLKIEADQRFYLEALDRAAVVAHGRLSHECQPDSHTRRRLILTRRAPDLAPDPDNPKTWLWNPAGATLEEACAAVGCEGGTLAIAGGTEVFSLFLKIGYDDFYLARAVEVRLPGGVPVFCQGRFGQPPEDVLRDAGLKPAESRWLDDDVSLVKWTP